MGLGFLTLEDSIDVVLCTTSLDRNFILLISGQTITKNKSSCDGLESGLRLSRKSLPLGLNYINSSHHEIKFRVPDVRANSFGGS